MRAAIARHLPFSYGWLIVALAALGGAFISGVTSWGLGVFVTPMQEELGWSRAAFFLPLAIGAVVAGVAGPLTGPLLDRRHGPQAWFLAGSLTFSASLLALRWVEGLWAYYAWFGAVGGLGRYGLFTIRSVIPKWFVRRRGRAIAVIASGTSLGPLLFPAAIQALVEAVGWRDAWWALGLTALAILGPGSLLVARQPEDLGLPPEAPRLPSPTAGAASTTGEPAFTRRQALATPTFWLLVGAITLGTAGVRGLIPNLQPFFIEQGVPVRAASASFSVYALLSMSVAFAWGWWAEHRGARIPFVTTCIWVTSAVGVLFWAHDATSAVLGMAYLGLALNGFFVLWQVFAPDVFGRTHYGAISGTLQPFNNAAIYGGPLLMGVAYDAGGYGAVFAAAGLLWAGATVSAALVARLR
jgi:OFA family oxalate/formate antiporter-like MFS transporter